MYKAGIFLSFLSIMCIVNAYDFRITNKTDMDLNIHLYGAGRTYITVRPKDDSVSHTKPLEMKLLKPGEGFNFSTTGFKCIGAIEAFGGAKNLLSKGKRGIIRCTYPNGTKGGECNFIDSIGEHCGSRGSRQELEIIEKNGKLQLKTKEYDNQTVNFLKIGDK